MARKYNPPWGKDILHQKYIVEGKSTYEIAADLDSYPNRVRNALIHYGYRMRNRSERQQVAVRNGRHMCPTRGRQRTPSEKINISRGASQGYANMSDDRKIEYAAAAKRRYESWTEEQKLEFRRKADEAIRKASVVGSKLEKFITDQLRNRGHSVEIHAERKISAENMHLDILLLESGIVIEVDGPSHSRDVWNEPDRFARRQERDAKKNGLLLQSGYKVIRVRYDKKMTVRSKQTLIEKLIETIDNIKDNQVNFINCDEL